MVYKIYIILILFFSSCNRFFSQDGVIVDLSNPQIVSVFDYFSHIELIPLETNENSVLGGFVDKIILHQNRFYVFDGRRINVFDKSGKFILTIGNEGRGPGEFIMLSDIIINPFTGNIDLLSAIEGRIHSYDLQGNHVKSSGRINNTEFPAPAIHRLIAISETEYVIFPFGYHYPYKIIYYDLDKMNIVRQLYEGSSFAQNADPSHPFYEYNGEWYFFMALDRTTYKVEPHSLVKAYTWDFGRFNYDANSRKYPTDINRMTEMYVQLPYRIFNQGQNDRYVIAVIFISDNSVNYGVRLSIYDKLTQKSKFIEHFTETGYFILPIAITNEYVLSFGNYDEQTALKNFVNSEMLDDVNSQRLEAFINAEEEQNPVIIKYYFK